MDRMFYPSVFHTAEEGGYWVTFPDFPECMTQGDTADEAYMMATDALGLVISDMKKNGAELPPASAPDAVELSDSEFIVVIEFDTAAYLKRNSSKAVKKTLSIPEWLNEEAMSLDINFSQVLQNALKECIRAAENR